MGRLRRQTASTLLAERPHLASIRCLDELERVVDTLWVTYQQRLRRRARGLERVLAEVDHLQWTRRSERMDTEELSEARRGKLRDQMAEKIIDHICIHMPDFRELITDQAIFSSDHFASMQGVTNGDWTHGLLHPDQMIGERCLVDGTGHTTPVASLYLCGASCHPGPGVTFLPGYNCAHEVMAASATRPDTGQSEATSTAPAPAERAA